MACEGRTASGGRVPLEGGLRVVAEGIVGSVPGQPQFSGTAAKQLAELAAKVGAGRGDAPFPATHIAGGGPQPVGHLQLRPAAAQPLRDQSLSGGNLYGYVHNCIAFSCGSVARAQMCLSITFLAVLNPAHREQRQG